MTPWFSAVARPKACNSSKQSQNARFRIFRILCYSHQYAGTPGSEKSRETKHSWPQTRSVVMYDLFPIEI